MLWRVPEVALLVICVAILTAAFLLGSALGLRRSRADDERSPDGERSQAQLTTLEAAMLGLLALLLGFSFEMATTRWELRKEAGITEANAIGTTYLRTSLLPDAQRGAMRAQLVAYVDTRLSADAASPLSDARARNAAEARRIQGRLWDLAVAADFADPRPTTTGLFVQSLNATIDAHGTRVALGEDRVPEAVMWLLLAIAIGAVGLTGFASGVARRVRIVCGMLVIVLVSLVVMLIVDLDRPSRGFIRVSDANLRALRETMQP